jgi:hypothetical protein
MGSLLGALIRLIFRSPRLFTHFTPNPELSIWAGCFVLKYLTPSCSKSSIIVSLSGYQGDVSPIGIISFELI